MSLSTSAAFRRYYMDGGVPLVKARLYLSDSSVVEVGGERITLGGVSVTGATSPSGSFSVGSAIVGTATVTLANYDGWLDLLDLEDARLMLWAGADVGASEPEWALLGTYDVATPETRGRTYPLQCRDYMGRFEVPYSGIGTTYPATLATIMTDMCSSVGVSLSHTDFPNASYVVQERMKDDVSCIDMVEFVAQLACSWATMTPEGLLDFGWYDPLAFDGAGSWLDGGTFAGSQTPYADGDDANGGGFMYGGQDYSGGSFADSTGYASVSAIRSLVTGTDDITITGLRVTAMDEIVESGEGHEGETYRYGTTGYELAIEGNPLVTYGTAQDVAEMVAPYVVGLTFRTSDASVVGDPSLRAGDAMVLTDRFGKAYRSYATQVTWNSGGSQRLACEAVAPSRKAMAGRTGIVTRAISRVKEDLRTVGGVAAEAKSVAEAINQHFWVGDDGIHVTQVSQESWETSPSGPNVLINSLGQLLRVGLSNLVSYTQGATAFYDGLGNALTNVIARYGRDGARIGYDNKTHLDIGDSGMSIKTPSSFNGFEVGLGEREAAQFERDSNPIDSVPFDHYLTYAPLDGSVRVYRGTGNSYNPPSGEDSYSFTLVGSVVTVTDQRLVGYGYAVLYTATNFVDVALTVGRRNPYNAVGVCSSALGSSVSASGEFSVAEGQSTAAVGRSSHAEGQATEANGICAHAEGYNTVANGNYSHAGGYATVASGNSQMAIGRWNVEDDSNTYALIIGNGSGPSRLSNALTVDWYGNARFANDAIISTISSVVTVNSSVARVTEAQACRWGKVCQLHIRWESVNAISVPAEGNINNLVIGTIVDGLRPAIMTVAHSYGDNAGAAWYHINTQGKISLGAMEGTGTARTIAAGSIFTCLATYILA